MNFFVSVCLLIGGAFAIWEYNLDWYINKKPEYDFTVKRIPKDKDYLEKYFVQSCSGIYCNYTHNWQGGGVTGYQVSKQAVTSTGTATAIDANGHWLTARHVVDGCSRIRLRAGEGEDIYVRKARLHPEKDLAILYTEPVDVPYVKIAHRAPRKFANGYVSGFAGGGTGIMYLNLLGSNNYRHAKADSLEYTLIWSREKGFHAHVGELFGFSGSSILNNKGEVVSVMQGYSSAYSKNTATATSTLASIYELTSDIPGLEESRDGALSLKLTRDNFFREGKKLRKEHAIVLAVCEA
ncbi:MAG: serine protease [Candidatus Thiodiazotropha sp.]